MMSAFWTLDGRVRQIAHQMDRQRRHGGERDIHAWPRRRDPDHVPARISQRLEIDRNRLGIAEQERRAQHQKQRRQQYGAERIDVLERIEADTAQAPSRVVAEHERHEAVRGLVEGDRDDDRDHPGRCLEECHLESVLKSMPSRRPGGRAGRPYCICGFIRSATWKYFRA
jgi:hypothetical protein